MKTLLHIACLLLTTGIFAQDAFTEADAKGIIDTFFAGFHEGDVEKMKSVLGEDVPLQTAYATPDGNNRIADGGIEKLIDAIANRPEDQKWEEKLLDYKVQIDGNLAHVWTPYEFWLNDTFSHCGANAFTLAKTDDGWKIIHLIDSRRRGSCKQS